MMDSVFDSVVIIYREFFKFFRGMGLFFFLLIEEMFEMGMVKVLNVFVGLLDGSVNLVKKIIFNFEKVVEVLQSWDGKYIRYIVGFLFLVYRLIKYCMDCNIKFNLEKNSFIIMFGGWKRFIGEEIL